MKNSIPGAIETPPDPCFLSLGCCEVGERDTDGEGEGDGDGKGGGGGRREEEVIVVYMFGITWLSVCESMF